MMKNLLVSCLIGTAVFSAMAEDRSMTFTYADDEFGFWGKEKSEIYDVAIRISDPYLVGKKITGIRAVLNAYEGIESTSIWLSKELTLEKVGNIKVTVPDTYSADVAPEQVTLPNEPDDIFGQLSSKLDEPYVVTDEGIYVGYSLTVPAVGKGEELTLKQKYPLLLSYCNDPESLYVRFSKDFVKWVPYNDKLGVAAMIYVTLEGEFAEYSVGIKNLETTYAPADKDFKVRGSISTPGLKDVSSIGYTYSIDGKSYEGTIDFENPLPSSLVKTTTVTFPIAGVPEIGAYTLDLNINKVNGVENDNVNSASTSNVNVIPYVPVHRPLLEEYTGTWCGWCPRGYYSLETLNDLYGDRVVLAAYHYNDPMDPEGYPINVGTLSFPSATLNRNGIEDPFFGRAEDGFGMKEEVIQSMETAVPVDIAVKAYWGDEAKKEIKIETSSTFFENKENAGYKVGYIVINNGLTGQGSDWEQVNYFASYASVFEGTELEVLTTWPSKINDLVYNDVVVGVDGAVGFRNSLPDNISFNETYESTFSCNIASNTVIQDKDKLYVAAFIINPDGTILNANKTKVVEGMAVGSLNADAREISSEFYNLSGARVNDPQEGVFVKVSKMSDGTVRTTKIIR